MVTKVLNHDNIDHIKNFINDCFGEDVVSNINKLTKELKHFNLSNRDMIFLINTCDTLYKTIENLITNKINIDYLQNKEVINKLLINFNFIKEVNNSVDNDELSLMTKDYMSDDIVKSYLRNLPNRLLTFEEIVSLYKRMDFGDKAARDIVITYNLRLVVSIAKKYTNLGVDFEDLISAGHEGLILAVDKYDYTLGLAFSNYAIWWIRQSITRTIANESRIIRIPVYAHELVLKIKQFSLDYYINYNKYPSVLTIANSLNLKVDFVNSVLPIIDGVSSLNESVANDEFGDTEVIELLKSDIDVEDDVVEKISNKELVDYVFNQMNLSEREKAIIAYRFGFVDGKIYKLEEVGNMFNITRERVRQIEYNAILKLKNSAYVKKLCC